MTTEVISFPILKIKLIRETELINLYLKATIFLMITKSIDGDFRLTVIVAADTDIDMLSWSLSPAGQVVQVSTGRGVRSSQHIGLPTPGH